MDELGDVSWGETLETYLASTGEKAHCLSWIHKRAEERYSYYRTFIDLPVIVLSSLVGFLQVGSTTMFVGDEMLASIILGVISLFVSVLNTTGTYFSFAKRAEGHRIAHLQYAKLYRFLAVEMGLPRKERMSPKDLLKMTKDNYDRLQEISPLIPPAIQQQFREKFGKLHEISQPEEVNGLEKIEVFVPKEDELRRTPSASSQLTLRTPQGARTSLRPPAPATRQETLGTVSPAATARASAHTSARPVPPSPSVSSQVQEESEDGSPSSSRPEGL
jgi:hypothetical protein